jgi:hypothetical protein
VYVWAWRKNHRDAHTKNEIPIQLSYDVNMPTFYTLHDNCKYYFDLLKSVLLLEVFYGILKKKFLGRITSLALLFNKSNAIFLWSTCFESAGHAALFTAAACLISSRYRNISSQHYSWKWLPTTPLLAILRRLRSPLGRTLAQKFSLVFKWINKHFYKFNIKSC